MSKWQNSAGSVNEIDFNTALARLLRDASLREQFAREPAIIAAQLQLRAAERAAFAALSAEEIEIQAMILLRKRFEAVRRVIPATLQLLGDKAWEFFLAHARGDWPPAPGVEIRDAEKFCAHLSKVQPAALCPIEMNRLRFRLNRQAIALHYVPNFRLRGRMRPALHILVRRGSGWSEHALYFALD